MRDWRSLADQVVARCHHLATHSEEAEALTCTFLSPPMRAVHRALGEWLEQAGLVVRREPEDVARALEVMAGFVGRLEGVAHVGRA